MEKILASCLNDVSGGNERIYYWNVQTVCTIKNVFITFINILNNIEYLQLLQIPILIL